LRRALKERGLLDRCLLATTSDHGENLLDHEPPFSHGATLYDATLRILAAVRAPGRIPPGRLDARLFENVDVLPTVGVLAGWDLPDAWEGRSFAAPGPEARPVAFGQLNRDFAVRSADRKVILRETGERSVLHLDTDPGEQHPETDPALEENAAARLAEWLARRATPLYLSQSRSVRPEELSPETVEKLRALGYLE
jgi:arylsulfatase A-like enzyme